MRTNMKESISQAKMLVQHVGSRADIYAAIQQVEDLHAVLREQLEGLPSVTKSAGDKSPSKQRMAEEEAKKSATLTVAMVLQKEGFFGFYKGLSSGLVSYAATWSTYYFSYYKLREYFIREDYSMKSSLVNLSNSTFAGIITCIVTNPLWVVNTRLKLAKKKSSGWTLLEVQKMIAEEGVGSCFKGLGASLVLVTNPAIQFLLVEKLNDWMLSSGWNSETITPMHRFFIGAISKLISTLITYPLQVGEREREREEGGGVREGERAHEAGAWWCHVRGLPLVSALPLSLTYPPHTHTHTHTPSLHADHQNAPAGGEEVAAQEADGGRRRGGGGGRRRGFARDARQAHHHAQRTRLAARDAGKAEPGEEAQILRLAARYSLLDYLAGGDWRPLPRPLGEDHADCAYIRVPHVLPRYCASAPCEDLCCESASQQLECAGGGESAQGQSVCLLLPLLHAVWRALNGGARLNIHWWCIPRTRCCIFAPRYFGQGGREVGGGEELREGERRFVVLCLSSRVT